MAITASQAQGLVLALFGASAGGHLAALKTSADAATLAGDLAAAAGLILGQDLSSDEAFRDLIIDSNLKLSGDAQTEAKAWMDGEFAKGTSRADILTAAITFLEGLTDETNAFYATAAAYRTTVADAVTWSEGAGATEFGVAALREQQGHTEEVVGSSFTLTSGTDTFTGTAGDDVFVAAGDNIGTADVVVDNSSTDSDTLNITNDAFDASVDTTGGGQARFRGIEAVNVAFDSLTNSTLDMGGVTGATTLTVTQNRAGSGATVTVSNVDGGTTVAAGSGVNDLTVTMATAGEDVTVDGGAATTAVSATVSDAAADADLGVVSVTANTAASVTAVAATGSATVNAAAATTINVTGKTQTITSGAASTITVTGDGTADTSNISLAASSTIANAAGNAVETINVTGTTAVTATITTTAATKYTGDANTTFAGAESLFDGKTVTGAAALKLTTMGSSDLSKVGSSVVVDVNDTTAGTLSLNNNASVKVTANSLGLTIDADDDVTDTSSVYLTGTLNLELNKDVTAAAVTIDNSGASDDGFDTVNLSVTAAQTSLNLLAGTADVVATGSKALVLDNTSTFDTLDGSAMTGKLTAEANATALVITAGAGSDALTAASTSTSLAVTAGSGNDTVTTAVAVAGTLAGGDGTDTLDITGVVDLSAATITGFEYIDINGNAVTIDEAVVNAANVVIDGNAALTVKNFLTSLNLSSLVFASSASVTVDATTGKDATLGSSAAFEITGSSAADTITTLDGADTIVSGKGADSITAGAGADTIQSGDDADTVAGGDGNDNIDGGAGSDTSLAGDAGNDTINGGTGDDSITGGAGADSLTGGTGADTFVFAALASGLTASTLDTITDYVSDTDIIDFGATAIVIDAAAAAAVAGTAKISATGIATFHADDDTLAEKLAAIVSAITDSSATVAGESAVFVQDGQAYLYINGDTDTTADTQDTLIKLTGITSLTDGLTITSGNITAIA